MNQFFSWPDSLNRFIRFTTARAEAINAALDQVSSGFDLVDQKISGSSGSNIRVPIDEYLSPLPNAEARANKILTFDGNGKPTVSLPSAGSATSLSLLLSSGAGAAQIGSLAADLANTYAMDLAQRLRPMVSVLQFLTPTERSAVLSGNWSGVGDCSTSLQRAINSGESLDFHRLTYRAHGLQFYFGDTGSEASRSYFGQGAVIQGPGGSGNSYLADISGQNFDIEGINFQGLGAHDVSYASLLRFHTRANAVNLDKVRLMNSTLRQNWKACIYGLAADTTAKVSETFLQNVNMLQCEQLVEMQGAALCDFVAYGGLYSPSARSDGDANNNAIIKCPKGQALFVGSEVVSTDLNGNASAGWLAYIPDGSMNAKVTFTSCLTEAKQGINIGSSCTNVEVRFNGLANGYWGWLFNGTALFNVGSNSTGAIVLQGTRWTHSYGHGPNILTCNSPGFKFITDEGCGFTSELDSAVNAMTKTIGGLTNFPSMEVAMLSGRLSNPTPASGVGTVKFAVDRISAKYTAHRFRGLVSDSLITVPPEGLSDAVIECQVDVDQASTPIKPTRHTSVNCNVTAGSNYVSIATDQYKGGDLYERGIAPGARVFNGAGVSLGAVQALDFDNGVFRLTANYPGSTGQAMLSFEIDFPAIVKGAIQRIALGDLWPGDKLRLTINPPSATTDSTLSYQRFRLLGKSRMTSMTLNGGI